jgi:photosystem II stability/assembly factor-like uncharacterized protein
MKKYLQLNCSVGYMYSKFYFLLIVIFFPTPFFSQWKLINPAPFIDDSFVIYADSQECAVLTQRANLVSSTNGGITWNYFYSNLIVDINLVFMIDKNNGWSVSGTSTLKTTNGGYNWEDKGNILAFANSDIYFSDPLHGWSTGNNYIKSTTDGGETWSTYTMSWNPQLEFISQYDDSVFFTGGYDSLYKSTNKGISWNTTLGPPDFYYFKKFYTIYTDSSNIGLLIGNGFDIARTTDEGESWDLVFQNNGQYEINDIKYKNNILLTCGTDKVFRSTNFGESWDTVYVPEGVYHTIYFATDNIIYVSGENGTLIKSTDGGISFSSITITFFSDHINSISLSGSLHGFITTWHNVRVYKTTDGGLSFSNITPANFLHENNKIYAVSNTMAVATNDIKIFTTKNGGLSWNVSSYGTPNMYIPNDVYFKDTLNGMAGCSWNLMRETTNGGDTWTNRFFTQDTTQEHILSISFPNSSLGFYTTGDKLYKTTNGGTDWNLFQILNPQLGKIKFVDVLNGVGSDYNSIYYTTDGGITWSKCNFINHFYDFDIKINGTGSVLMVVADDSLYTSFDLGKTCESEKIPYDELVHIIMKDPATAWLSGFNGKIIQYHNPLIPIYVQSENSSKYLVNFGLLQNFPNPFNPSTSIQYAVSSPANGTGRQFVTLKVYDILGNEIATLVNEEKQPGSYEVEFNTSSFKHLPSSGIYFYQLRAGDYIETKKMVLIK